MRFVLMLLLLLLLLAAGCGGDAASTLRDVLGGDTPALEDAVELKGDVHLRTPDFGGEHPPDLWLPDEFVLPEVPADAQPETTGPIPCQANEECPEGLCIQVSPDSEEGVCTFPCLTDDACPPSWVCKTVYVDYPDMMSVCIPPTDTLCRVCEGDAECLLSGSLCVTEGNAYGYCGRSCSFAEQDCPEGFLCQVAVDGEGKELGHQCLPAPGNCCLSGDLAGCDQGNSCQQAVCHPTLGCQYDPVEGPCVGEDLCLEYECADGECVGTPITTDATNDGIDDDCDGLTDEDVPKLVKLNAAYFGSGGGPSSSDGFVLAGSLSCTPVRGTGSSDKFVLETGIFGILEQ